MRLSDALTLGDNDGIMEDDKCNDDSADDYSDEESNKNHCTKIITHQTQRKHNKKDIKATQCQRIKKKTSFGGV